MSSHRSEAHERSPGGKSRVRPERKQPAGEVSVSKPTPATGTPAILNKCYNYTRPQDVKKAGIPYPFFRTISDSEDTVVTIEGKQRIMLGSNNYLGLTHHPKVLEAATNALKRYGSGCTGSRFLNGTLEMHCQLEEVIAEFIGKESAMIFSTGYMANLGVISALMSRRNTVYLDKLDHASIVDGASMAAGESCSKAQSSTLHSEKASGSTASSPTNSSKCARTERSVNHAR